MTDDDPARRILDLYVALPDTPDRPRTNDRRLARLLASQNIPFEQIEAALLLAQGRRIRRDADADPLHPIRSLHYFLPALEEIRNNLPLTEGWLDYCRRICRQAGARI